MEILDTQLLIWICHEPERLPASLGRRLQTDRSFYFSLASLWEVSIKSSLAKPGFQINVGDFYFELMKLGFEELAISFKHIEAAGRLPWIHRDPFDRLLIATAATESNAAHPATLLTVDTTLTGYGASVRLAR